jgi:predicted amidophosphoribosyltransferase
MRNPALPARFLRHLLPGACLLCDRALPPDVHLDLCPDCHASLPWNGPACPRCALPLGGPPGGCPPGPCRACLARPPPFATALAPLRYEGCTRVWVTGLKEWLGLVEGRLLGMLMADVAARHYESAGTRPDLLIPVPLSPWRLARRGHNQALTLALPVARRLHVPVLRHAVARHGGGHQRGRSRTQRLEAAADLFVGRTVWHPPGPCVAIVDDVLTTGATAAALARVLLAAGAREVQVIAAARTPNRMG